MGGEGAARGGGHRKEKQAKKDASPWYVQILRAGNEAFEVMLKGDDE